MTPIDELKKGLDELCIKYTIDDSNDYEVIEWQGSYNLWWQFVYDPYDGEPYGELRLLETGSTHLNPKQAIAVTVGERNPDGLPIGLTISNDGNLLNWMGENYVRQDAATVGTEPDEATMLKLHDRMNAALLDYESAMGIDGGNVANIVPFVNEMHQIIEDAATVGVGTCEGSFHESSDLSSGRVPLYYCKATNKSIFIGREARFCPLCGKRIKEESE